MEQFTTSAKTQITNEQKAKEYLIRYLGELKLHFNLEDEHITKILCSSYLELNKETIVHKCFSVLKSFLRLK